MLNNINKTTHLYCSRWPLKYAYILTDNSKTSWRKNIFFNQRNGFLKMLSMIKVSQGFWWVVHGNYIVRGRWLQRPSPWKSNALCGRKMEEIKRNILLMCQGEKESRVRGLHLWVGPLLHVPISSGFCDPMADKQLKWHIWTALNWCISPMTKPPPEVVSLVWITCAGMT